MTQYRNTIIEQFRDRIASNQRTRLYQTDLQELIYSFVRHLATLKTKAQIKAFCLAEIALLEEGYPKSSVGKIYLPQYRAAIKDAIYNKTLPLTKTNSRQYAYAKRNTGETSTAIDHISLDYLKYDQNTYEQFAPTAFSSAPSPAHEPDIQPPSIAPNLTNLLLCNKKLNVSGHVLMLLPLHLLMN